ncbi:hypothetical protein [Alloacidobacterium sp.]|uniref:hypothetical protein n=1 Tax=Alloacidobacterium sp. TaxID=2951999 RepID=UPI002D56605F|nr:hypothetical protein [Alloacidobacterium sp.]HYK37149.1 hypothetical protein [Alloacidobacterium sp.]
MPKPLLTIENWGVVQGISSHSFGHLQSGNRLVGHVFGHERVPQTSVSCTSTIISIDLNRGVVETLHTTYRLGQMNDEYKLWESRRSGSVAA